MCDRIKWLTCAAEQKHPEAAYKLAQYYKENKIKDDKNPKTQYITWLSTAADLENATAQFELTKLYVTGYTDGGFKADESKVEKWFRCAVAADEKNADKNYEFGKFLYERRKNFTEAITFLEQARTCGFNQSTGISVECLCSMCVLEAKESKPADRLKAAKTISNRFNSDQCSLPERSFIQERVLTFEESGECDLINLAMYQHQKNKEKSEAKSNLSALAEIKNISPKQKFELALLYEKTGEISQTVKLYIQLLDSEFKGLDDPACKGEVLYKLAYHYQKKPELEKAASLYRIAAQEHNLEAIARLFEMNVRSHEQESTDDLTRWLGEQKPQAQYAWAKYKQEENKPQEALPFYQLAAAQGYAAAQDALGLCYERGIGIAKDEKLAVSWYRKSAVQGNPDALDHLAQCYQNGIGVDQNQEVAAILLAAVKELRQEQLESDGIWKKQLTDLEQQTCTPSASSATLEKNLLTQRESTRESRDEGERKPEVTTGRPK